MLGTLTLYSYDAVEASFHWPRPHLVCPNLRMTSNQEIEVQDGGFRFGFPRSDNLLDPSFPRFPSYSFAGKRASSTFFVCIFFVGVRVN